MITTSDATERKIAETPELPVRDAMEAMLKALSALAEERIEIVEGCRRAVALISACAEHHRVEFSSLIGVESETDDLVLHGDAGWDALRVESDRARARAYGEEVRASVVAEAKRIMAVLTSGQTGS